MPEHNYAIATLTNGSKGSAANRDLIRWALERDLGLVTHDPEPVEQDSSWVERRLGVYRAALTQSTLRRTDDGKGLEIELISYNPFSGDPAPPKSFPVTTVKDGMMVTDGAMKGAVIDFIDGDQGESAPPAYARVGLRLAKRQ